MSGQSVNGWTPPVMYDVQTDKSRAATQEDVDQLVRDRQALMTLRRAIDDGLRVAARLQGRDSA